jgi:hypothetical protein
MCFLLCLTTIWAGCATLPMESHRDVYHLPCRELETFVATLRSTDSTDELRRQDLLYRIEALEISCALFQHRVDSCMKKHSMTQAEAERAAARQSIQYAMMTNFRKPERSIDIPWGWIVGGIVVSAVVVGYVYMLVKAWAESMDAG